jgi:hypothetical protein
MSYVTRSKFNVVFPVGNIMSNMNFNNTSVVSWQSDLFNLLMEEIEYKGKTTSSQGQHLPLKGNNFLSRATTSSQGQQHPLKGNNILSRTTTSSQGQQHPLKGNNLLSKSGNRVQRENNILSRATGNRVQRENNILSSRLPETC